MEEEPTPVRQADLWSRTLTGLTEPRAFFLFIFLVLTLVLYTDYVKTKLQMEVLNTLTANIYAEREARLEANARMIEMLIEMVAQRPLPPGAP